MHIRAIIGKTWFHQLRSTRVTLQLHAACACHARRKKTGPSSVPLSSPFPRSPLSLLVYRDIFLFFVSTSRPLPKSSHQGRDVPHPIADSTGSHTFNPTRGESLTTSMFRRRRSNEAGSPKEKSSIWGRIRREWIRQVCTKGNLKFFSSYFFLIFCLLDFFSLCVIFWRAGLAGAPHHRRSYGRFHLI